MINNINIEITGTEGRLVDDAYLVWFSAERACEDALHTWFSGSGSGRGSDREVAYFAYLAALDREEAAARDLQRTLELPESCRETTVHGNQGV